MDGQTTRLSEDAAHWANEQVEQGRFGSTEEVVDAAIALYRAELEDEPEVDWDKASALAADGRAQVARGEYIEFADAAAMDSHFKGGHPVPEGWPSRLIWPASATLAKQKRS
jgi:Arc/MetJ-type ribon-helix-helix transcriptional regulator